MRRLDSLTGVRALAALAVIVGHASVMLVYIHGRTLFATTFLGQPAVICFFMLSGVVLTWSSLGVGAPTFYRRRFARIYPLYFAAVLLGLAACEWQHASTRGAPGVLSTLTLTQAWVPGNVNLDAVLPPAWSLSLEAFFYLVFPFVAPRIVRLSVRGRRSLAGACLAWLAASSVVIALYGSSGTAQSVTVNWAARWFPPSVLPVFILGIVIALELRDGLRVPGWAPIAAWVAGLGVDFWTSNASGAAVGPLLPAICLSLIWLAGRDLSGAGSPLSTRPLVRLGEWSYAAYLLHYTVFRVALSAVGPLYWSSPIVRFAIEQRWVFVAAAIGVGVVAAKLAHERVEVPVERLLRGQRAAKAKNPAVDAAAVTVTL